MRRISWTAWLVLTLAGALSACAPAPDLPPVPQYTPVQLATLQWHAVLVAGDGSLHVFDNAVLRMATWLRQRNVDPDGIIRLSAASGPAAQGATPASWNGTLQAVRNIKAGPGQACLFFMTSHGRRDAGVALSYDGAILRPAELDSALATGCGNAPTVAIVSACFSGDFAAPPMARANRIVITAARADRASFGCGADQTYTYFDRCLLSNLNRAARWRDLVDVTRACVSRREQRNRLLPSEPQAWFGPAVQDLPMPR